MDACLDTNENMRKEVCLVADKNSPKQAGTKVTIDDLKFDEKGLIPAIVVDVDTNEVLTLAYMNRESLGISLKKRLTCFWSRSRQELWLKGETSGNYQHIVSITADCDQDALVVKVKPDGPACHLGNFSCFEFPLLEE